jgi:type IV pilus assembly protein PilN
MARINLLPWREERRRERTRRFGIAMVVGVAVSAAVIAAVHLIYQDRIDGQNARNAYLEEQIAILDDKIKKIQRLERERQQLIDRMRAIETLQTSRPVVVRLFDEIVIALPDGVSITEISQSNTEWTFKGISESNARVSNFMRNIEASPAFKEPRLDIIETKGGETKGGDKPAATGKVEEQRRVNNFTISYSGRAKRPRRPTAAPARRRARGARHERIRSTTARAQEHRELAQICQGSGDRAGVPAGISSRLVRRPARPCSNKTWRASRPRSSISMP